MAIIGIPSTRVSDQFVRQRLLDQVQSDQVELFRLQTQLATGRKFEVPSEDSVAAQRVMSLQLLLERKGQVRSNLNTNQSYLNATDTALSQISSLMAETRGTVLSVFGTTASDTQRQAAAQQVEQALRQLIDSGNQMFRGRYLFAGSQTTTLPFVIESNAVRYDGNERRLSSFANIGLLFDTNLQGDEVFGAISGPVRGGADLDPVVTRWTRLADLRGGRGITRGSITISDGATTKIIDLSGAETVGDLAALVHANPPDGKTVDVDITPTGVVLRLDSGSLSINEVGGGTTAAELGILRREAVGTTPVESADLDPRLAPTTRLGDLLGARAMAVLRPAGGDNDIVFQADHRGDELNGVTISLVDDGSVHAGNETVSYDPVAKTLVVRIEDGYTTAANVVSAVHAAHQAALGGGPPQPFTAALDFLDSQMGGAGLIDSTVTPPVVTAHGAGSDFDQQSGLVIRNGSTSYTIDVSRAVTVEDLLNALNSSGAAVLAAINEKGTGVDVRSRLSGVDFAIGENGGITATQLGLRTFTGTTELGDLNFALGVDDYQGPGPKARATLSLPGLANDLVFEALQEGISWNGYTVELTAGAGPASVAWDPVAKRIDVTFVAGVTTAADVISLFNATPGARDFFRIDLDRSSDGGNSEGQGLVAAGTAVTAQGSSADADFTITRRDGVSFEIDVHGKTTIAEILDLINNDPVNLGSGVPVVARLAARGNGIELVDQSAGAGRLTVTKSLSSMAAIELGLIPPGETTNAAAAAPGQPDVLTGADVNSKETEGLFTALLRLQDALARNDIWELQRGMDMLDRATVDMNFSRAELGTRQQGLDVLQNRLDSEEVELKQTMSQEYDADIVEVVSKLTARQLAYEASLKATAEISRMSLLSYL